MKEYKAPQKYTLGKNEKAIFLCGSIEMGKAENWQDKIVRKLKDAKNLVILNPRRDDWDSSWVQEMSNPQFREQVEWELKGQEESTVIPCYFDPATKSPITLLELGLFVKKMVVCCPEGFYRKGNVDIVCNRYCVTMAKDVDDLVKKTLEALLKK